MKSSDWSLVLVALISLVSALLAGRSSRKAAKSNNDASITNARTVAETEAYNRARKMDIETITRQDKEIDELRNKVRELQTDNDRIHEENRRLKRRVSRLEEQYQEEISE